MSSEPIRRGPARVFIDGEELTGGINSMRWDGDKLIAKVDAKVFGSIEPPPEIVSMSIEARPENTERSGSMTLHRPRVPLRTRLWCWAWHGHWPHRRDAFDFSLDQYRCPCGDVVMAAEELLELSARYDRRGPPLDPRPSRRIS